VPCVPGTAFGDGSGHHARMSDRSPGHGRYAHPEREQRWIVSAAPTDLTPVASIVDRYIVGTRLRLRRSESEATLTYKLGQKVRDDPGNPEMVRLTNIYLSEDEYSALLLLPAAELHKTRSRTVWTDRVVAIDRFHGRLDGLMLGEVELSPTDSLLPIPPWAAEDVTNDDRFSGGALAFAADAAIEALLR
jgi:CYTH domain-containing protein